MDAGANARAGHDAILLVAQTPAFRSENQEFPDIDGLQAFAERRTPFVCITPQQWHAADFSAIIGANTVFQLSLPDAPEENGARYDQIFCVSQGTRYALGSFVLPIRRKPSCCSRA